MCCTNPDLLTPVRLGTNNNCSVVIPSIILAGVNAYRLWTEHWEHVAHGPALEDKPEYPFQNIRTKNYFWGDGDKVRTRDPYGAIDPPCCPQELTPDADPLLEPQGQLPQEGVEKKLLGYDKYAPVILVLKADHASPANETAAAAAVCRKPIYFLCRNMQILLYRKDTGRNHLRCALLEESLLVLKVEDLMKILLN
jgi:hypothetical protein